MSYEKLYAWKVLLYADRFIGAVVWRESNVTISAQCGLELRRLKPRWWARIIGHHFLNRFWPGHCEGAIRHDAHACWESIRLLGFECDDPTVKR
ncbi:hypothetical protein UFOVP83_5 [uncultured Caudovirales phage]|uniref:Uncharacterized protein n=1 Tax=uncultured Caudovirales phage TaxID=2100421 RepID=A0A6J5TAY4_9CAUD|nr:hypothetical protein UFOVP83_5 [uncultured Caudovirales phage]